LATVVLTPFLMISVRDFLFSSTMSLSADSAMFLYGGDAILRGNSPSVDFWDVKPPLIYIITAVFAFLANGDMYLLYLISVIMTIAATIGTLLLLGKLVYYVCKDEIAALLAGITPLVFPPIYYLPTHGIKIKMFVAFFGFAALLLALRHRPLLAGAFGAVAAGIWQFGVIFVLAVLVIVWERDQSRDLYLTAISGGVITTLVISWLVWIGALQEALTQVVIAPIVTTENTTTLGRLVRIGVLAGYATPVFCFALLGLYRTRVHWQHRRWIVLLTGMFTL